MIEGIRKFLARVQTPPELVAINHEELSTLRESALSNFRSEQLKKSAINEGKAAKEARRIISRIPQACKKAAEKGFPFAVVHEFDHVDLSPTELRTITLVNGYLLDQRLRSCFLHVDQYGLVGDKTKHKLFIVDIASPHCTPDRATTAEG